MNWLLAVGDFDILRDANRAADVFWYRAKQGWRWVALAAVLTLVLVVSSTLLILGPQGSGIWWATREKLAWIAAGTFVAWAVFVGWLGFKFVPSRNDRVVIGHRRFVRQLVAPLEEEVKALSDDGLRAKTGELRQRLAAGEPLEAIRPLAYACVREAARRARNHRHFECQLIGARVLEECNVAEMRTGEGKTIVCYAANYMKVLQGLRVHMVTVNDYLVRRDAEFCRPIFELLGVSVGFINAEMETFGAGAEVRRAAYGCDITYGTNSEFGFDYLRDNMKHSRRDQVQGRQDFVVVDEVDSVLIDEARTPLIISGMAHDDVGNYRVADDVARKLIRKQEQAVRQMQGRIAELEANPPPQMKGEPKFKSGLKKFKADPLWLSSDEAEAIGLLQYFVVELDRKSAAMTEHGAKAAQSELGLGSFYDNKNMNWPHYIDNALKAHLVYQRDKEYVVQDGVIVIVDEFTGRLMQGRQWSDGLHQAVEAKENVQIKQETQTLATITLQNLFKLYKQLAGMTGTAMTESDEFMKIYKLEVIAIPTNKPIRRVDYNDKIYKTVTNKFDAIVEEIRSYSQHGYPADPWSLYDMLRAARRTLQHAGAAGQDDALIAQNTATINAALRQFNEGKGPEQPLIDAYKTLIGAELSGRPVLVGTVSVESSEKLSQALSRRFGIEHEVLNAKNHAREAEIVSKAGQQHETTRGREKQRWGNVTIATNMAGRGTDIVLGPGLAAIGGLHVVGTERHEARRIDNQLRGRCGRQGDPGSSRFFLSLEDDLLKLFMGEWVLRMLQLLGFEEGMAIEDKRLSRGIERAQKKVEERNFGIRKNLLEYDEVMDFQRKSFYSMRQRVVEGQGLSELIWEMIDQSVEDAVSRCLDPKYAAICVAEWVGQNLGVTIEHGRLDPREVNILIDQVRELAGSEVRTSIQRTFGEYIDPDVPSEEWDVRGLVQWAAHYGLNLTQRQVKETEPHELQEQIITAAINKIENADLSALQQFVDPAYGRSRLAAWAQTKFGLTIQLDEIKSLQVEEVQALLGEKMRAAYRQREIEYPVAAIIEFAVQRGGSNVNEIYSRIANWVNRKYRLDWTYEHLVGKAPHQIFQELKAINQDYLLNGRIEKEIEAALLAHPGESILSWAKERFGAALEGAQLRVGDGLREQLKQCAYQMLRYELTQLERSVLTNTFDAVWKDHMYSMGILRNAIGFRGYAERDPKIEYKREGTRLFAEANRAIRDRVTDLIFKVQVSAAPEELGDLPTRGLSNIQAQKADATNAGFSRAAQPQGNGEQPPQAAGSGQPIEPIRRAMPKVGRNEPCPCGSGKKYKQCHGRGQ